MEKRNTNSKYFIQTEELGSEVVGNHDSTKLMKKGDYLSTFLTGFGERITPRGLFKSTRESNVNELGTSSNEG
jgi:hypothetical protein